MGDLSALAAALQVARSIGERFNEAAFSEWTRREAADNKAYDLSRLDIFLARLHD